MAQAKAGWAEVEITPPVGLPMGGRGPDGPLGDTIIDSLYAQALIIEDAGGERTLWIAFDLISITHEDSVPLRFELSAATGIPMDAIILNCSHTHSGPGTCRGSHILELYLANPKLGAYMAQLTGKVRLLALQAASRMLPVEVAIYQGVSDVAINRRRPVGDNVKMAPNPDGHYNRDLWVLDLRGRSSGDRCVLFSYACHPVLVYRYARTSISPDYPGKCRKHLRAQLGESVHCQFMQSVAGNVRPRQVADLETGTFRNATPEDVETVGKQLANDIVTVLAGHGTTLELDLGFAEGWAALPRDQAAAAQTAHHYAQDENEKKHRFGKYWLDRIEHGPPLATHTPWSIGLIRLTRKHVIVHLGGDSLAEWLPLIRRWLPAYELFIWAYTQDFQGYLPTEELLDEGGYEVVRAPVMFKTGPGPLAAGLNNAMRRAIERLAKRAL